MATVPGTPIDNADGGIPKELQPTDADLLMAAAIHTERQRLAGDVIPFQRRTPDLTDPKELDEFKKMMTRDTLGRALGGAGKILPITPLGPGKTSMSIEPLDPGDEGRDITGEKVPLPKRRPKKAET